MHITRAGFARFTHLVLITAAIVSMAGCGGSPPPPTTGTTNTKTTNTETTTAERDFDLEAIMRTMATSLEAERDLLRKALKEWDAFDDADAQALAEIFAERRTHADEVEAMLTANPTWVRNVCEWYSSIVEETHISTLKLGTSLGREAGGPGSRSRYGALLLRVCGSKDAVREHLTWDDDHPGATSNVLLLCIKFGYVE